MLKDTVCAGSIAKLIHLAVTSVILLRVSQDFYSPESQTCSSVGPCSRHSKLHISGICSGQGQISKKCNVSPQYFRYM